MKIFITLVVLVLVSGFIVVQFDQVNFSGGEITASVDGLVSEAYAGEDFLKVYEAVPFEFPKDHGPHPDYRAEWWYYTGNLADAAGNRYGYQFTIFRRGIVPGEVERKSEWATRQIYFAHFTVTDVSGETFDFSERYSRASPALAGAQGEPHYRAWIDDWRVEEIAPGQVQIQATADDFAIDLLLEQAKPVALQGIDGYSAKGSEPGNASYYYSITNNPSQGTITTPRGTFTVTGNSWMDREWSTSDLGLDAVGWDWYSLQLDDNRELTFYFIRLNNGGIEPASAGILVNPDGSVTRLTLADIHTEALGSWTSPTSGATYPAGWHLTVPRHNIDLTITPLLSNQELNVSFTYWEGAVKVEGSQSGYGYIEMTGYDQSMQGRF